MSQSETTFSRSPLSKYIFMATVLVAVVFVGIVGTLSPFIAIGAAVACVVFVLLFKQPNLAVIIVSFIIYTNTAVVLMKYQNVPPVAAYALPLLLVIPFVWQIIVKKNKIKTDIVFVLMLVFFAVLLLGSAFSKDINSTMPDLLNYVSEGLMLYFMLINTVRTPKLLRQIVWAMLIGGALIGALSLYQQLTGTLDNNYWGFAQASGDTFITSETLQGNVTQMRAAGPIGEKNRYAQIMLMLVPLGLFLAWGETSQRLRLVAYILMGLVLVGGSLAFSRGAQVGFLMLIAVMSFMRYIKVHQLLIILMGLLFLLWAFPQNTVRFGSLGAIFASQEEGGLRSADGSIQGRATEMLAATLVFLDHPFLGVGPGMFDRELVEYSKLVGLRNIITARRAHSLYLGVAAENGLFGLLTLLAILFYTLYRLAQSRRYWMGRNNLRLANLSTGFFLAIIGYMVTGIFLHFAYIRYFWLIIALASVTSHFNEENIMVEEQTTGEIRS